MTAISIDLVSVLGVRQDGEVRISASPTRAAADGGWLSDVADEVPLVAGLATLNGVAPGPARIVVSTDAGDHGSNFYKSWQIVVPESGTHALQDLVDGQTDWPAPVVGAAQQAQAAAEAAAQRAEDAADNMEGGVRPGGWLLDDLAQEVLDQLGGGVALPIQMSDVDGLADWVSVVDATMVALPGVLDGKADTDHKHPVADLTTTGAAAGMVATVGAGGVAAWAAAGGGTPGVVVTGRLGVIGSITAPGEGAVAIAGRGALVDGTYAVKIGGPNAAIGGADAVSIGNVGGVSGNGIGISSGNSEVVPANTVRIGTSAHTTEMRGKATLGNGATQVTLSTRLDAGKVQFGITWPGSSTFIPLATQP